MKLVSIIVPIYNVAPYLSQCIDSLTAQSHSHLEIILVNDGSTDKSLSLCTKAQQADSRITIINQPNQGHGSACNAGIAKAVGEYICFCDGDDYYFPEMVAHLVKAIEISNAEVATGTAYPFINKSNISPVDPYHSLIRIPKLNLSDTLDAKSLQTHAHELSVQYWSKLYRHSWLIKNNIRFPQQKTRYDDVPFHWEILAKVNRLAIIREQIYAYRLERPGSSYSTINQSEYLAVRKTALSDLKKFRPGLLNQFYLSFIADMDWLNHMEQPIRQEFVLLLHQAVSDCKLNSETRKFIVEYLYRKSFRGLVKQKAKTIVRILFK